MNLKKPEEPDENRSETAIFESNTPPDNKKFMTNHIKYINRNIQNIIEQFGPKDYDEAIGHELAGRLRASVTGTILRLGVPTAFALILMTSPVMAQSGMAEEMCSSDGYNFMIAVVYVIVGLVSAGIVGAIFLGGGMKAFGWVARSVSSAGNKALVYSGASFALIALVMVMTGVAYTTLPAEAPTQCVSFW